MREKQLNFSVGQDTVALIDELKVAFEVTSAAAVFKRALALAKLAAAHRREDGTITLVGRDEKHRDIILNG